MATDKLTSTGFAPVRRVKDEEGIREYIDMGCYSLALDQSCLFANKFSDKYPVLDRTCPVVRYVSVQVTEVDTAIIVGKW